MITTQVLLPPRPARPPVSHFSHAGMDLLHGVALISTFPNLIQSQGYCHVAEGRVVSRLGLARRQNQISKVEEPWGGGVARSLIIR